MSGDPCAFQKWTSRARNSSKSDILKSKDIADTHLQYSAKTCEEKNDHFCPETRFTHS